MIIRAAVVGVLAFLTLGPAAPRSEHPPATTSAGVTPAAGCLDGMSLEERAGQVLMVGVPLGSPPALGGLVARYHLGGAFLSGRSTRPAAALRADIATLQRSAKVPLLIAVDQEGGSVQALRGDDFPAIPAASSVASPGRTVRDSAQRLAGIGVTVNLAPVADTVPAGLGEANPPIGAYGRQYGSDPDQVAATITTVVAASQGAGVQTVLKHFPGLGRVRANTDTSTYAVDRVATVEDAFLEPFVAGMSQGSAGVMVSSASYPRLDPESIAVFSRPIITGLLRDRLGYAGLIMSDDLGAADAVESIPIGDRAVRFVDAGGDLVLTIRPQQVAPMIQALTTAARRSPGFEARLTDAAGHVMRAKARAGLLTCP